MRGLIERHITYTGSEHAARILESWRNMSALFVKVMPRDYKRVLTAQAAAAAEGRQVEFSELVGAG